MNNLIDYTLNNFVIYFETDGTCRCGPFSWSTACDVDEDRYCVNATGVTYGDPNASFECSCSNDSHCPATTDTCNTTYQPSPMCECSTNGPNFTICDAGRDCQNVTGQPACSCLTVSDCLGDTADTCDTSTTPASCGCAANNNSDVCDEFRACLDLTAMPGQPACSCLDASHCLENSDTCNSTTYPPICECSSNAPNFTACDTGRVCLNTTEDSLQPACSCLTTSDCLGTSSDTCNTTASPPACECSSNVDESLAPCADGRTCITSTAFPNIIKISVQPACSCLDASDCTGDTSDTCNTTAIPPTCLCSSNADENFAPCDLNRTCLNTTLSPDQPACSCLDSSDCLGNTSDTCNNNMSPPTCECSFNTNSTPCDPGRTCLNLTLEIGQPACSCLSNDQCLENADTCNSATTPATCECSSNTNSEVCDLGRACINTTVDPSQPACSCLASSDCLADTADSCNMTATPPRCECSYNAPNNFEPCDTGRMCLNLTEEPLQPPCSCLNATTDCPVNADTCNATTGRCQCSANLPSLEPCEPGRTCIPGFGCSCESNQQCADLGWADTCNDDLNPPSCECSFNLPTNESCNELSTCLNLTLPEYQGQPPCSCLAAANCSDNSDTCNSTTTPPLCQCSANSPPSPCDPGRVCLNMTDYPLQPPCSCLDATDCVGETADTCNSSSTPPTCLCSSNVDENFVPCEDLRTCLNTTEHPDQPACSCLDASDCLGNSSDTCNSTMSPSTCECSFNSPTFMPCDVGRDCLNLTEMVGQPACSCLNASQCLDNADTCNSATVPTTCECSFNAPNFEPCDEGRMCLNMTENPGQPACSCLDSTTDCLGDTADTCNSTVIPPRCECSFNLPTFDPCPENRTCLNTTAEPLQPACSCLNATTDCEINADTCNSTTGRCECSANLPSLSPCDPGRVCIPGFGCSCETDDQCKALGSADFCNLTLSSPECQCSFNTPTLEACEASQTCLNLTELHGQPACSCLAASECYNTSDTCNSTLSPPLCQCEFNTPSMEPCEEPRVCLNRTEYPCQPGCSCLEDSHCTVTSDNCNTTSSLCQCGDLLDACHPDTLCVNNYTITGGLGPQCTCLASATRDVDGGSCLETANECDDTLDPPHCKCNGGEPCDPFRVCVDEECAPSCSCLVNDHCTEDNADVCDITTDPPHCRCGDGPACECGEVCVDGKCGVSVFNRLIFLR